MELRRRALAVGVGELAVGRALEAADPKVGAPRHLLCARGAEAPEPAARVRNAPLLRRPRAVTERGTTVLRQSASLWQGRGSR